MSDPKCKCCRCRNVHDEDKRVWKELRPGYRITTCPRCGGHDFRWKHETKR